MRRALLIVNALAALLLLGARPAWGQVVRVGGGGVEGPLLDYFVSRYHLAPDAEDRAEQDAVGGRLMWSLDPLAERGWGRWVGRVSLGGYLVHVPSGRARDELWRYGAQTDIRVAPDPIAGRLDPMVSLGVGALRVREPVLTGPRPPFATATRSGLRTGHYLSVTPGVALRVRLLPGIGLRADARQVIDFREGVHRNLELSGGLSVGG